MCPPVTTPPVPQQQTAGGEQDQRVAVPGDAAHAQSRGLLAHGPHSRRSGPVLQGVPLYCHVLHETSFQLLLDAEGGLRQASLE